MKELAKKPAPGEKGSIYSGRCAGGSFQGFQVLMIAPDDDSLAKAWEALQYVELRRDLVYDVSVIARPKLDALLGAEPKPQTQPLDVE